MWRDMRRSERGKASSARHPKTKEGTHPKTKEGLVGEDKGYGLILAYLVLVIAVICVLACGCSRAVYVPMESVSYRTDTLRVINSRVDSVVMRDSVAVYVKGDTVRITQYRDRFRWRDRVDTVYKARVDTARVEVPVTVEKELSRWEKIKMDFGGLALGGVLVLVVAAVGWLLYRRRRE